MMWRRSVVVLLLAGCAADDDWVVRNPGGGTGSNTPGVDSGVTVDAPPVTGDGGRELTGVICVVTDLRRPDRCPVVDEAVGVLVRRVGDVDGALSDGDGRFALAVPEPAVVLELARDSTTLQPSIVPVVDVGGLVHASVPTAAAWDATAASLAVTIAPGTGAIAVYTDDATGAPAAGVLFDLPSGALDGPFYDGSSTTAWTTAGGTGGYGATLVVGLVPGDYQLTGNQGARTVQLASVPVYADAVTFVRATLPP